MTQLSLIPQPKSEEDKHRRQILATIKKRRSVLQKIVVKTEMLRVQLDILKREYMVKIGSLVVKDNHLDLDIIKLRNILLLMEEGKTYQEAEEELAQTFYAEQLEIEKEEETVRLAERVFEKARLQQSLEIQANIRKLWRKLISQFHPDLTQDMQEKKKREEVMKQINVAYEMGDIQSLSKIERDHTVLTETPTEGLEDLLLKIENEIIQQEKHFADLKQSEWYKWHLTLTKTDKTLDDIYKNTEKKLLNDIVAKMDIVRELRKELENKKI